MIFPLPDWLQEMPDGPAKDRALSRFYIRLSCLYAVPSGRLIEFAPMIGVGYGALKAQLTSRDQRGATQAVREGIHRVLGPTFVPPPHVDRRFKNW